MVTKEAITSTNTGSRTSGLTRLRMSETVTLERASTAVVASPIPRPLVAEVVVQEGDAQPLRLPGPLQARMMGVCL
mgnify:CR=1 FL=1